MRRRIVRSTLGVVAAVVVLLGLPLAIAGAHNARSDAESRLEREADAIAAAVQDRAESGTGINAKSLSRYVRAGRQVTIRFADGRPALALGTPVIGGRILARSGAGQSATVLVEMSDEEVDDRVRRVLLAVGGLAVLALAGAVGLAFVQAARLARPLDDLTRASARLGAGDFSGSTPRHGIAETDAVAEALDASAGRIAELVQREREFSSNVSHQLRSPLTALRLHLEEVGAAEDLDAARLEATEALEQADRLQATIGELLAFARQGRAGPQVSLDVAALVGERAQRWRRALVGEGRDLDVDAPVGAWARATSGGLRHAVDVLLENAWRHGGGTVRVRVTSRADRVVVHVEDEGGGIPLGMERDVFARDVSGGGGTGVGLALARTLVEADGGRLDLVRARPAAFEITLRDASARTP